MLRLRPPTITTFRLASTTTDFGKQLIPDQHILCFPATDNLKKEIKKEEKNKIKLKSVNSIKIQAKLNLCNLGSI